MLATLEAPKKTQDLYLCLFFCFCFLFCLPENRGKGENGGE
jgi:hypothetical protein